MKKKVRLLLLGSIFLGSCTMAIEEPSYEVLLETKYYDVRRYQSYIVAEVNVENDDDRADSNAFRILAGYLFGDNEAQHKMNMTAPVESTEGDGPYTYSFVMERKYSMESLPKPTDPNIRLVRRPARVMAIHRYSGDWSRQRYEEREKILLEALATDRVATRGAPVFARYNGPFTPWFLRRNEIMVEIEWRDTG